MAQRTQTATRRIGVGLAALALVAIGVFGLGVILKPKPARAVRNQTVPVTAARAETRDVPVTLTELGAATPWQGVTVRAQVSGRLSKVLFTEGRMVNRGDLLAEIDDAPYRAALMQAQGALKRDEALLEQARLDLKRYQVLADQNSIARQQVETQAALVKQDEGTVLLDRGAVAAAQVNVNYTRIRAPLSGRVGVRLVDAGNVVTPTDAQGIVIINEISPIAVTFNAPEADFQRILKASDGFARPLAVTALSQETGEPLGTGALTIGDNHVDPATGTVALKARFDNQDRRLWPSQFVNARLTLGVVKDALVVPTAAVNPGPKGVFVYVVGADHRVSVRPVKPLSSDDRITAVEGDVRPGDLVVTDGQMQLKPHAQVAIASADQARAKETVKGP